MLCWLAALMVYAMPPRELPSFNGCSSASLQDAKQEQCSRHRDAPTTSSRLALQQAWLPRIVSMCMHICSGLPVRCRDALDSSAGRIVGFVAGSCLAAAQQPPQAGYCSRTAAVQVYDSCAVVWLQRRRQIDQKLYSANEWSCSNIQPIQNTSAGTAEKTAPRQSETQTRASGLSMLRAIVICYGQAGSAWR